MTEPTLRAVEDAIRDHLAVISNHDGEMLTDWVVVAATYIPEYDDEAAGYIRLIRDGQPLHATIGLLANAREDLLTNALASKIEQD